MSKQRDALAAQLLREVRDHAAQPGRPQRLPPELLGRINDFLTTRRGPRPKTSASEIVRLRDQGKRPAEIAAALKIGLTKVYSTLAAADSLLKPKTGQ